MAEVIIIEGPSGTGKSTSLRNIDPKEMNAALIVPNSKPLPFRGGDAKWGKRKIHVTEMNGIPTAIDELVKKGVKNIIIEDFSHYFNTRILSDDFMSKSSGSATFERWKHFARDVMKALFLKAPHMPADVRIIVFHHVDKGDDQFSKFKIFGKLLGDNLDPVSYVRIVLHTTILPDKKGDDRFVFQTQQDAAREAKSPMGMFTEMYIPNDLAEVIKAISAYDSGEEVVSPSEILEA
jgi:hypothetical protein